MKGQQQKQSHKMLELRQVARLELDIATKEEPARRLALQRWDWKQKSLLVA